MLQWVKTGCTVISTACLQKLDIGDHEMVLPNVRDIYDCVYVRSVTLKAN